MSFHRFTKTDCEEVLSLTARHFPNGDCCWLLQCHTAIFIAQSILRWQFVWIYTMLDVEEQHSVAMWRTAALQSLSGLTHTPIYTWIRTHTQTLMHQCWAIVLLLLGNHWQLSSATVVQMPATCLMWLLSIYTVMHSRTHTKVKMFTKFRVYVC